MSHEYRIPLSKIDEAKNIVERLNRSEITALRAMDELYYLAYGRWPDHELEALIQRIKKCGTPPYHDDDPYCERPPWNKFGGVSSGIGMVWRWYDTDVIINKYNLTMEDVTAAMREIRESEFEKMANFKEAPCVISNESENSAPASQERGKKFRTGDSGNSCAIFSGLWAKIRSSRKTTK